MDFKRKNKNKSRGYTMPHKEFMDEQGIKYESLSEHLKSSIRLFEDKYDQYQNSEGYLDEKEESELLADSEKIRQNIEKWLSEDENDDNGGKVAAVVTLSLLGFIGLMFGIKSLRE